MWRRAPWWRRSSRESREGRQEHSRQDGSGPRSASREYLFGAGLLRARDEVKARSSGFLRSGELWCDLLPFRDHRLELAASADSLSCLLSLEPGDPGAPLLDASDILARAEKLGFDRLSLFTAAELARLLAQLAAAKTAVPGVPISRRTDGSATVVISRMGCAPGSRSRRGGAGDASHLGGHHGSCPRERREDLPRRRRAQGHSRVLEKPPAEPRRVRAGCPGGNPYRAPMESWSGWCPSCPPRRPRP